MAASATNRLWNAAATGSRVHLTPAAANASAARSISVRRPGQHRLVRRVLVRDDEIERPVGDDALDVGSGASTASIAPGSPARCSAISRPRSRDSVNRSRRREPPGRGQRDEFAVAVPGERVGRRARTARPGLATPRSSPRRVPAGRFACRAGRRPGASSARRRTSSAGRCGRESRAHRWSSCDSAATARWRRRARRASPGTGRRGRGACRRTATPGRGTAPRACPARAACRSAPLRACAMPWRPARSASFAFALATSFGRSVERAVGGEARAGTWRTRRTTRATASAKRAKAVHSVGTFASSAASCLRRVRAERDDLDRAVPVHLALLGPVFFQHRVEVAAAEAERGERRPARVLGSRQPRPHLGVDVERRVGRRAAARPASSP